MTDPIKEQLAPCPFCGSRAHSEIVCLGSEVVTVKCSNSFNCPVGPVIRDEFVKGDGEAALKRFKAQWNTRAYTAEQQSQKDAPEVRRELVWEEDNRRYEAQGDSGFRYEVQNLGGILAARENWNASIILGSVWLMTKAAGKDNAKEICESHHAAILAGIEKVRASGTDSKAIDILRDTKAFLENTTLLGTYALHVKIDAFLTSLEKETR